MDSQERIPETRVRGERQSPGLGATIEEIRAAGICGCGRRYPHGGRCAWARQHSKNGTDGGGQRKP
jgi:hypothetical protein